LSKAESFWQEPDIANLPIGTVHRFIAQVEDQPEISATWLLPQ
jgi:hypothetical protein